MLGKLISKVAGAIPLRTIGEVAPETISRAVDDLGVLAKRYPEVANKNLYGGVDLYENKELLGQAWRASGETANTPTGWYDPLRASMSIRGPNSTIPWKPAKDPGWDVLSRGPSQLDRFGRLVTHEFGHAVHFNILDKINAAARYPMPAHHAADALSMRLHELTGGRSIPKLIDSEYASEDTFEEFAELFSHTRHEAPVAGIQNMMGRVETLIDDPISGTWADELLDQHYQASSSGVLTPVHPRMSPRRPSSGRMGGVPARNRSTRIAHNRQF